MSKTSQLKVKMEFVARVYVGDDLISEARQTMGFPDKLDEYDNEQVVISLGEGQKMAGSIADQCANVAVWRAAYDLRRIEAEKLAKEEAAMDEADALAAE